jgi:hypothetical protein
MLFDQSLQRWVRYPYRIPDVYLLSSRLAPSEFLVLFWFSQFFPVFNLCFFILIERSTGTRYYGSGP